MTAGPCVLRIIERVDGQRDRHAGRFLVEFTPDPYNVVTTDDKAQAMMFPTPGEALELWRKDTGRVRADGKPDRPLSVYTVEVVRVNG